MVFSSIVFLFYFLPIFLFIYFLADKRYKNIVILAGSIFFYAWGAPQFIFVLLGTTIIDFYVVRAMHGAKTKLLKQLLLGASLTVNVGLLFYFKYCDFFIQNINALLKLTGTNPIEWTKVIMPIGISFYTFETLTYVIDVYRGVHKPLRNFWDYQLYIILFPKLIAGPIIRFHDFAHQIYDHTANENTDNRLRGFYRFFLGLGKKVLIANVVGEAASLVFDIPVANLSTYSAWIGALSYTLQIYFDFSGYSDMAIGLGLMMGFRFPENFNNPYTALSVTDFWRRWHITLGSWMRNYLYIPLGGNRVQNKLRLYFNLWLVFLLSGLWHGATWGFVAWGAYHGFFLAAERFVLGKWLAKLGKASVIYTFLVVLVGWVFFKTEHVTPALHHLYQMFTWHSGPRLWQFDSEFYTSLSIGLLFSFFALTGIGERIHQKVFLKDYTLSRHFAMAFVALAICVLAAGRISVSNFNPSSISDFDAMKDKTKKGLLFFLLLILSLPMLQSGLQIVDSGSLWGFTPSADVPFTIDGWWNNTYQHSKETYAKEQVGFHADFVRLNNQISYSVFDKPNFWKGKVGKENCLWGADYIDAYYGTDFIGEENMTIKMRKLRKLQDTLSALGKSLIMVYAPSKACFYPEYFPKEYTDKPKITSNLDCSVRLADSLGINHIDMNAWFLSMKQTTKAPLFLKSSIHWSVYGAELGADTLIKYMEQLRHIKMPHITFYKLPYFIKPMLSENDLILPMNIFQAPILDSFCHPHMGYSTPKQCEKPKAIYIGDSFTWIWFETDIWNNIHKEWIYWNYFKRTNRGSKIYDEPSQPNVTDTDWINDLLQTDCVVLVYTTINLKELGNGFIEKAYDHFYPQQ